MTFRSPLRYIICIDMVVKKNPGRFEQFTGPLKFAQTYHIYFACSQKLAEGGDIYQLGIIVYQSIFDGFLGIFSKSADFSEL